MLTPLDRVCPARHVIALRPVEYMVCKDGKPFAILNATPALAERTVTGLAQACLAAIWSVERA